MKLDIDLAKQTPADNLPDEAEDEMLPHFDNVAAANVDHREADTLGGLDNDVVVLRHLEVVEVLGLPPGNVEDTLVNGIRYAVVDELRQDQAVLAIVEHLKSVGGEGEAAPDVGVAGQNGIDVAGELGSLVLVDGMRDVRAGALDLNPAATRAARTTGMAAGTVGNDAGRFRFRCRTGG